MDDKHKIRKLENALSTLLSACDWDDVMEVGGRPLENAVEVANEVLKCVEVDSESNELILEALPRTVVYTLQDGDIDPEECLYADQWNPDIDDDYLSDWVDDMGDN